MAAVLENKLKDAGLKKVTKSSGPRFELEANNRDWAVEGYEKTPEPLKIEEPKMNHNVYIRNCNGTHVHVSKKINNVVIENCSNVVLVVDNVISTVEVIRSDGCQIQVLGRAPAVTLDNCSGVDIYASLQSKDVQITSSQIADVNLHVPQDEKNPDEWIEFPIPAQFIHQITSGTNSLASKVSDLYR